MDTLKLVYDTVEQAQLKKAIFSMEDCRNFLISYKILSDFYTNKTLVSQKEIDAFTCFCNGVKLQHGKGIFTIEGSVLLLECLELLEKELKN
jgi:hypothetical protein